jgi:hypothetical protein
MAVPTVRGPEFVVIVRSGTGISIIWRIGYNMDITNPLPNPNSRFPITMEGHVYLIGGLLYTARTRTGDDDGYGHDY